MIYQQFFSRVTELPQQTAVSLGDSILSYADLDAKIGQLSSYMSQKGVGSKDVVALAVPAGIDFVVATFAIYRLGAVLLPLNVRFTDQEIEVYLRRSGAGYVICPEQDSERYTGLAASIRAIAPSDHTPVDRIIDAVEPDPECPALIIFSSGSTGESKQVTRRYSDIVAEWNSAKVTIGISSEDTIVCTVPMFHSHGFGNCVMSALLSGAELAIVPGEFNPRATVKCMARRSVSIYPSAPFMLKMLSSLRFKEAPDLSALRLVYTAGAPLDGEVATQFKDVFGLTVRQLYGSTETGAISVSLNDQSPENSVGQPLDSVRVEVLDENGIKQGPGDEGEIVVYSLAAAKAYDGDPDRTAESFVDGGYLTGDLGCLDENGNLFVTGRKKLMINVAGLKVDPTEVEQVIAGLPNVGEVVVVGVHDGDYGEKVKAVIVASGDISSADVEQACAEKLVEYKRPKEIEFRSEIPRSPLGKILRKYLQ